MSSPINVITDVTIANYVRSYWDAYSKMNPFFGILEQKANIRKGLSGTTVNWPLRGARYGTTTLADYQDVSNLYVPQKQFAQAILPWGEVGAFDAVSKGEFAKNDGNEALVRLRDVRVPLMVKDLISNAGNTTTQQGSLAWQILNVNGATYTGSGNPIYGLPTIFQDNASYSAASKTATSSGTYAGFSLATNSLSSVLDNAVDNAWTPTLVNTTSTAWAGGAGNATFRFNAFEVLSFAARSISFDGSDSSLKPTFGLLASTMFDDLRYQVTSKQTIFLQEAPGTDEYWGVGSAVAYALHEGIRYYWDANMPTNTGYVLNAEQLYLDVLKVPPRISGDTMPGAKFSKTDMFDGEVNYNDTRRAVTVSITFRGQLRANPRYQAKLFNYA
jgi:hypothetical protein